MSILTSRGNPGYRQGLSLRVTAPALDPTIRLDHTGVWVLLQMRVFKPVYERKLSLMTAAQSGQSLLELRGIVPA